MQIHDASHPEFEKQQPPVAETVGNPHPVASGRNRTTLVVFLALLMIFVAVNVSMAAPYLLAVIMGGILSILAKPLYQKLLRWKFGPKWASGITVFAVLFLVIAPLSTFGIVAVKQAVVFGQKIAASPDFSTRSILGKISNWGPISRIGGNAESIERQVRSAVQSGARQGSAALLATVGALPDQILQGFLALLTCFFMLIDGRRFRNWMDGKIPLDRDVRTQLYRTFQDTAISVIWATLAAASAQAVIMWLAYLILGVPLAFLAAGATFIFAWIPILGSTPVWLGGAIYLYTQGHVGKAVVMLAFGAFTGIIDNFIRPLVLKGRSDLHPLISLVAIFGGIQLFGIFGVFFGPILTAVMLGLLQVWPSVAMRFDLMRQETQWDAITPHDAAVPGLTRDPGASAASDAEQPARRGRAGQA